MKVLYFILHISTAMLSSILLHGFIYNKEIGNFVHCIFNKCTERNSPHVSNDEDENQRMSDIKNSSVWCWGSNHLDRVCYFHNLYFISDLNEFIFVHGEDSSYHGLPPNHFAPTLLDLSSVHDHNGHYFNYVDIAFENAKKLLDSVIEISFPTLVLQRFHPDNLMHVFHDDLLPIYHTLDTFAPLFQWSIKEVQLVFMDKRSPGKYKYLYEMFSSKVSPLYRSLMPNNTFCFSRVLVGLLKNTTWYQYGFVKPQGPLQINFVDGSMIRKFSDFVLKAMNVEILPKILKGTAVLLLRKQNRLILNEVELVYRLVHDLGTKIEVMSEETHSLFEIVSRISNAEILIGMHGSLLILSLFLHPGALLVELFPYGINPDHYTPYKTLVEILHTDVSYARWRNLDVNKTVTYPNRLPAEGGIEHLEKEEQERIQSNIEVPQHLCCDDPNWLFRIYQDTQVSVTQVVELVRNKRLSIDHLSHVQATGRPFVPYRVKSLKCLSSIGSTMSLIMSWEPPVNVDSVQDGLVYELWLQEVDTDSYLNLRTSMNSHTFTSEDGIKHLTSYYIWIRCITSKNTAGPFNNNRFLCMTN